MNPLTTIAISAAFVAGTLQGSRLPEPAPADDVMVAQQQTRYPANRAGSGAGPDDAPPPRDGVLA
jgi:hypothetical protein